VQQFGTASSGKIGTRKKRMETFCGGSDEKAQRRQQGYLTVHHKGGGGEGLTDGDATQWGVCGGKGGRKKSGSDKRLLNIREAHGMDLKGEKR